LDGLTRATLDKVIAIVAHHSGVPAARLHANSAIDQDLKITGDDVTVREGQHSIDGGIGAAADSGPSIGHRAVAENVVSGGTALIGYPASGDNFTGGKRVER